LDSRVFPGIFVADFHFKKDDRGFGLALEKSLPEPTGGTIKIDAAAPYSCEFKVTISLS
jgi:hypothetical protein